MKELGFSRDAQAGLDELFEWIADRAGLTIAKSYTDRLKTACQGLDAFPLRGVARDDIRAGLRVMGWRRRAAIAFAVEADRVIVLRILHKGRDVELALVDKGR